MGTTTNYAWPYPEPGSSVDVARDIKALANAIDITAKTRLNPPTVQVRQTAAQTIASGAQPPLLLDSEDFDTHGMHAASPNPSRLICTVPGVFLLWGIISFAGNATGRRFAYIFKNGTAVSQAIYVNPGSASWVGSASTVAARLNANDYVELAAQHEAGVNLATMVSAVYNQPVLGALWIAP